MLRDGASGDLVNTYRWLMVGSLAASAAWSVGACGSSGDETTGTGGKENRGGSAGRGGSGNVSGRGGASGFGGTGVSGAAGGTSDPGGAGGEGGYDGETCAATEQQAELTPANLLFVLDKSGSMNCNPPEGDEALNARCANFPIQEDPNEPTKWEVTRLAFVDALDALAEQPNVQGGLMLFPVPERAAPNASVREEACWVDGVADVEVGALDASGRDDISTVLAAVAPAGETPIVGATILGYKYLSEAIRAGDIEGNHFVVLLTDGAETCELGLLQELVDVDVPNARLLNIRTFVIGAPGSEEARSLLSDIAFEGGTATSSSCSHGGSTPDVGDCHFDMTESLDLAGDLARALEEISRTTVLACEYEVPENPDGGGVNLDEVNVTFTSGSGRRERILKNDSGDCDTVDGWQYSEDFTKILLCGDVCDRVQADSEGKVNIELGCPTVVR
jgi:hypothetical protein